MAESDNKDSNGLPTGDLSFEAAMEELEAIVTKLEKGDLPLEESINAFKKGISLSKYCNKRLEDAERKISILLENEKGIITEQEFSANPVEKEEGFKL